MASPITKAFAKAHRKEREVQIEHKLKMRLESRKGRAEGRMLRSPNPNITDDLLLNRCHIKDFEASASTQCWHAGRVFKVSLLHTAARTRSG